MLKEEVSLYPFQNIGLSFIKKHKHVLIGDSMGLGKSLQSIASMSPLEQSLVICPAMLKQNWEIEIKKFTNLSVKQVDSKYDYTSVPDVIISSYENVKNIPVDILPNHITLDESHYIKNMSAKRTKSVHNYINAVKPEYLVCLSGTPITTSVIEFYSVLKLLSNCGTNGTPIPFKSQYAFNMRFSHQTTRNINVTNRYGNSKNVQVQQFTGIKNKEELKSYLKNKYIRRVASKVLNLPKIVDKELIVSTKKSKNDKFLFEAFEDNEEMSEHITALKIDSAMKKVPFTLKYIDDIIATGEQVVIFSDHIQPIKAIAEGLNENKISHGVVCGYKSKFERNNAIESFKEKKIKVLICSFSAAAVGLTLTTSRNLVFNDLSWRADMIEQARKRIHRISQERSCLITTICNGDFDIRIKRKLDKKRKDIAEIVREDK